MRSDGLWMTKNGWKSGTGNVQDFQPFLLYGDFEGGYSRCSRITLTEYIGAV